MEFSLIIYAAIGGGIGGAIAALIVSMLEKNSNKKKPNKNLGAGLAAALVVGGSITTTTLYKNMTLPRIIPMDVAEMTEEVPYLKYIEEQDPVAFKKLMFPIDKIERSGQRSQDGVTEFRAQLQEIISEKQATASAETLRAQNLVGSELFDILTVKAPQVCTQKFYGRPFQWLDEILDDDFGKRENQAMAKYFTNPSRQDTYVTDLTRGEALFNEIFLKLVDELDIENLDPPMNDEPATLALHIKICNLQSKLNHATNELSDDDLLHVVSYIGALE